MVTRKKQVKKTSKKTANKNKEVPRGKETLRISVYENVTVIYNLEKDKSVEIKNDLIGAPFDINLDTISYEGVDYYIICNNDNSFTVFESNGYNDELLLYSNGKWSYNASSYTEIIKDNYFLNYLEYAIWAFVPEEKIKSYWEPISSLK